MRELKQEYNLSTLQDEQVQWALDPSTNTAALPGLLAAGGQIHQQSLF